MAWTAPMTAVANSVLNASEWNTHLRDNLLETAPAKAEQTHGIFLTSSDGSGDLVEFPIVHETVTDSGTTSSTSYVDLEGAEAGPVLNVRTSGTVIVVMLTWMASDLDLLQGYMSFESDTGHAANDLYSTQTTLHISGAQDTSGHETRICAATRVNIGAGNARLTAKYRVSSSSGALTCKNRTMIAIPL